MSLAVVCLSSVVVLALAGTGGSVRLTTATHAVSLTPRTAVSGPSPYARCTAVGSTQSPEANAASAPYPNTEVEPYVAANPRTVGTSQVNLIGVWQQDRFPGAGARGLASASSFDGGRTWTEVPLPFTSCARGGLDYPVASDPWVSFGPDGTAYASALIGNPAVPEWGVAVAISHDGGRSWGNTRTVIRDRCCDFSDKESVTADPDKPGVAYVVWSREQGASEPTWFAKTTDGGTTWTRPHPILRGPDLVTTANQVVIDPQTDTLDDILSLAHERPAHRPPCHAAQRPRRCPSSPQEVGEASLAWSVALMRSRDGGETWSAPSIIAREQAVGVPAHTRRIRTGTEIPSAAIDRKTGAISVVWQDGRFARGAYDEIALARSVDGGVHWTSPSRVSSDAGWPAFTPAVAVSAEGVIGVTFYRFRSVPLSDPGLPTDYWFTWSRDGGSHFESEMDLAGPFDMLTAPRSDGPFLGDYEGLTSVADSFVPFFVQTNSGGTERRTTVATRTITPHTGYEPALSRPVLSPPRKQLPVRRDHLNLIDQRVGHPAWTAERDPRADSHQLNGKEPPMIPRRAIATASALALLSSTAIGPFASRTLAMHAATAAGTRTSAVSVARRYFGILDHQGLSGHDYHALNRLYAPGITLTESLTSGRPRTHRGLRQVQAFDRWMRLDWIVDRVEQRSPSVVLTIERSRTSPGHEGVRADP